MQDHDLAIRISSNGGGRPRVVMLQLGRAKSVLIALINSSVFVAFQRHFDRMPQCAPKPLKEAAVCAVPFPAPMRCGID